MIGLYEYQDAFSLLSGQPSRLGGRAPLHIMEHLGCIAEARSWLDL